MNDEQTSNEKDTYPDPTRPLTPKGIAEDLNRDLSGDDVRDAGGTEASDTEVEE